MKTKELLLTATLGILCLGVNAQLPYQNPKLSFEERAQDLLSRLTLEEKASLMCDISPAIPRLGIKDFNWWSEALHGFTANDGITCFPEPIGMAASFDEANLFKTYSYVSDEVRALYAQRMRNGEKNTRFHSLSVWTPNINIFRDPRWGRGQETYGEDPYLTSRMGIQVIKGLQGSDTCKYRKLLACAKHFAVHSGPEWSRHTLNVYDLSPRDFWETYLPAFKSAVQEGNVQEVMCAYQRLDDEPCCGNNRLLQQILRDDWGFKHLVVSDCGAIADFWQSHKVSSDATHSAAKGVMAGTDVECGFGYAYMDLPKAVEKGLISEKEIDEHVLRLLKARFSLGDMDDASIVNWNQIPFSVVDCNEHRQQAYNMAQESMTLLQNRNGILPLNKNIKRIAVIGPNADDEIMLWGNYNGKPTRTTTILLGIKNKIGADRVCYDKVCDLVADKLNESLFDKCVNGGKKGLEATYWNNKDMSGEPVIVEHILSPLQLTTMGQHSFADGVKIKDFSAKYVTDYTAEKTEELYIKISETGVFDIKINGTSIYNLDNWHSVPMRIPVKVEAGKTYHIAATFKSNDNQAGLDLNFCRELPMDYKSCLNKVKDADVVVFVGGLSPQLEGEEMPVELPGFKGGDRTDIELPNVQREILKTLKAAGKKVIMVNCSGSAVAMVPETQSCDAILQAWYGGEEAGAAVADVLFGDYNPSGKLPITFYKSVKQLPGFEDYSMKGRTYRYTNDALFPFGFGLSYTKFKVGKASITGNTDKSRQITIPVSNIGKKDGTEILQIYIRKIGDDKGPIKSLRGFKRAYIKAGKKTLVDIKLPDSAFEFFDYGTNTMRTIPGDYEVKYGNSSADNDLQTITIKI
ncbi:MAG: glycoside hydrolase family 3 C-terminal domain-containing protein [Prevotella sp.]|nr:glycoside hydrolase family 3 C-terminal domain-containing protein [Prevotella sp.]